jgi:hypothetical protein
MKPTIDNTTFGSIEVDGTVYNHDMIIHSNGQVEKRKKKLSKAVYGTSHTVSLEEIKYTYDTGAQKIIIGNGQYGALKLSDKACEFLQSRNCEILMKETPEAIKFWNKEEGILIGLFHLTC